MGRAPHASGFSPSMGDLGFSTGVRASGGLELAGGCRGRSVSGGERGGGRWATGGRRAQSGLGLRGGGCRWGGRGPDVKVGGCRCGCMQTYMVGGCRCGWGSGHTQ